MRHYFLLALWARVAIALIAGLTFVTPVLAQNTTGVIKTGDAAKAKAKAQKINEQSAINLKRIGLNLLQYLQDWDEKFPPMNSAQSVAEIEKAKGVNWKIEDAENVQQTLFPYVKNAKIFAHPFTGELYRPNFALSGRSTFDFKERAPIVAFYEASPASDGTRAVLYFDGRVTRERETDWPRIRAQSDTIAPPFGTRVDAVTANQSGATVKLHGEAATAYQIAQWKKNPQHTQTLYLSKSTNRIYYRDDKTKQAIWVDPPAQGITLSQAQAAPFRAYKGYNGQAKGRVMSDDFKVQ